MVIRVLIVGDHRVVREGLRMFFVRDSDLEVVGEVVDGDEAIQQCRMLRPDAVIMDLLMPVMNGMTATRDPSSHTHSHRRIERTSNASPFSHSFE